MAVKMRKRASEDEIAIAVTGEYCDGYAYIVDNGDGWLDCDLQVECWGDEGEFPVDSGVYIKDGDSRYIAAEIAQEVESEYGGDLSIDEEYLVSQIEFYFKSAKRAHRSVLSKSSRRPANRRRKTAGIELEWIDDGFDDYHDHWWFAYYNEYDISVCERDGSEGAWDAFQWQILDGELNEIVGQGSESSLYGAQEAAEAELAEFVVEGTRKRKASLRTCRKRFARRKHAYTVEQVMSEYEYLTGRKIDVDEAQEILWMAEDTGADISEIISEWVMLGSRRKHALFDEFEVAGTPYTLKIDGMSVVVMKDGREVGIVGNAGSLSEYKLVGAISKQIDMPMDDYEREMMQDALFEAALDVVDYFQSGDIFSYASRKRAINKKARIIASKKMADYVDMYEFPLNGETAYEGTLCDGKYWFEIYPIDDGNWETRVTCEDPRDDEFAFGYGMTVERSLQDAVNEMKDKGVEVTASHKKAKDFTASRKRATNKKARMIAKRLMRKRADGWFKQDLAFDGGFGWQREYDDSPFGMIGEVYSDGSWSLYSPADNMGRRSVIDNGNESDTEMAKYICDAVAGSKNSYASHKRATNKKSKRTMHKKADFDDGVWWDRWIVLREGYTQKMQAVELKARIDPFSLKASLCIFLDGRSWHSRGDSGFEFDEIFNSLVSFGEEETIKRFSMRKRAMNDEDFATCVDDTYAGCMDFIDEGYDSYSDVQSEAYSYCQSWADEMGVELSSDEEDDIVQIVMDELEHDGLVQ